MKRSELIDLFRRYPKPNIAEDDFDDLLWWAVCEWVSGNAMLKSLPIPVRVYYVTRYVEWEIANGGLDQLLFNVWNTSHRSGDAVVEFLTLAKEGYAALGRSGAEKLMDRVLNLTRSEFARLHSLPEWIPDADDAFDDYFDAEAIETVQTEGIDANKGEDLWSDDERLAYVVANKDAFIGMAEES